MKLVNATTILLLAMLAVELQVDPRSSTLDIHDMYGEWGPSPLRGAGRLLGGAPKHYTSSGKSKGRMTCNKYPRVCHVKGSAGPDCCKKKCVSVRTDKLNCGMCGYKCAHQETCCNGRCVDPLRDPKHCGCAGCAATSAPTKLNCGIV